MLRVFNLLIFVCSDHISFKFQIDRIIKNVLQEMTTGQYKQMFSVLVIFVLNIDGISSEVCTTKQKSFTQTQI